MFRQEPRSQTLKCFSSIGYTMVLEKGLEPLRLTALDPKSSVSANSTTQACLFSQ